MTSPRLKPEKKPHLRKTRSGWLCSLYIKSSFPYTLTTIAQTPSQAYWRLRLTQPLLQNASLIPQTP